MAVPRFNHVAPKELPSGSQAGALVFQARRHIGKQAVDASVVARLKTVIRAKDKRNLLKDARYTTDWMADIVRQIAGRAGKERVRNNFPI